jgi:DNA-directed RNA polymerase specialized sigma24 family protein
VESVEERILGQARHGTLHRALERASAHERDLVRLMLDQPALSYEEISAALRMPRDSIGPTRGR